MFGLVIAYLIILSIPVLFSCVYNRKFDEFIAVSIIFVSAYLYLSGILDVLKYGCYALAIIAIFNYCYSIYYIIKNKRILKSIKNFMTPGFVIWSIFIIFIAYINFGRVYYNWDEYTLWGKRIYEMYYINGLITSPRSIINSSYPQGFGLIQYFFQFFHYTGYREWISYLSYQTFYISLAIYFLKNLKWNFKNIIKYIFSILIIFILPLVFYSNFYSSIYVDSIIGIEFGYLMAIIILNKKDNIFYYLCLLGGFYILLQTKDCGLILSFTCLLTLTTKQVLNYIRSKNKSIIKYILPIIVIVLSIIIIYITGKMLSNSYIQYHNIPTSITNTYTSGVTDFINVLLGKDTTYKTKVYNKFLKYMFKSRYILDLSTFKIFIILIALISIALLLNEKDINIKKIKSVSYIICIILGLGVYLAFLLYCYLTFFSASEALSLASLGRYIDTFNIGMLSTGIFMLLNNQEKNKINNIILIIITVFIIYNYKSINCFKELINKTNLQDGQNYRNYFFTEYSNNIHYLLKDNKNRLYIISQDSNGIDHLILSYLLRDKLSAHNQDKYSITVNENKINDKYTEVYTADEFMYDLLNNYDYLVLFQTNENFNKDYGNLFENKNNIYDRQLYKVDKEKRKLVLVE